MTTPVATPAPAAIKAASEFLIACARANLDESAAALINPIVRRSTFDWNLVHAMSREHGVTPLVHRALRHVDPSLVPLALRDEMERFMQINVRRNFQLMNELLKLLTTLNSRGVRAMPFKGPLLALTAYGDLSLRHAGDIDIIVPQADLRLARSIVPSLQFQPMESETEEFERRFIGSPHEYAFNYTKQHSDILMELHWMFAGTLFSFNPDPAEMWDRGEARTIGGSPVHLFSPEDYVLVLCAHGMRHFWTRLTWICDIAQFIKAHPNIHWRKMLHRAADLKARNMTLLGLVLAHHVLNAPVPKFVMGLSGSQIHTQAAELEHRLFLPMTDRDDMPRGGRAQLIDGGLISSLLFHLRTRESLASGLRYCFHRALTPTMIDQGWLTLPPSMSFLYYVLRPVRLAWKYGPFGFLRSGHRNATDVESQNQ